LLANLNSLAFDFISRQKIQSTTINLFILEQLPVIAPARFEERIGKHKIADFIRDRCCIFPTPLTISRPLPAIWVTTVRPSPGTTRTAVPAWWRSMHCSCTVWLVGRRRRLDTRQLPYRPRAGRSGIRRLPNQDTDIGRAAGNQRRPARRPLIGTVGAGGTALLHAPASGQSGMRCHQRAGTPPIESSALSISALRSAAAAPPRTTSRQAVRPSA